MTTLSPSDNASIVEVKEEYEEANTDDETDTITGKKEEEKEIVEDKGGLLRLHKEYGQEYNFMFYVGMIVSLANGCIMIIFAIAFREILTVLGNWYDRRQRFLDGEREKEPSVDDSALHVLFYFVGMGIGSFILTTIQYYCFGVYASRLGVKVRKEYFAVVLRQEISYHEEQTSSKVNTTLNSNCDTIQEGIGIKLGFAVQQIGTFLFGCVMAFYYSWELTLILLACIPVIGLIGFLQGKFIAQAQSGAAADPFAEKPGTLSQEVLTNIKIILAYPSLILEKLKDYKTLLDEIVPQANKKQYLMGLSIGFFFWGMFAVMYPVSLYFGAGLIDDGKLTVGDLFGSYFAFFMAGMGLGQIGSVTGDIKDAITASNKFFAIIERRPVIRSSDKSEIDFNNGRIKVKAGQSIALVGPSGSGKSTVIKLIERFYDPNEGSILIDDEEIHNYNIDYLRSSLGLVSQMPLLFDDTIENNIRGGNTTATKEEVMAAARQAFAHDFIMKQDKQYETNVGELGNKLSGGQKQRIAISRVLLANPKILLLDEATSALDTNSEKLVQQSIDNITNITKIIIAHRLSTIKNCDLILVLVDGKIIEYGTHNSLMNLEGAYSVLVKSQTLLEEHHLKHLKMKQQSETNLLEEINEEDIKKTDVEIIFKEETNHFGARENEIEGNGNNDTNDKETNEI